MAAGCLTSLAASQVETIGDCFIAAAGIPVAQPDHTLRIAQFALEAVRVANETEVDEEDPLKAR